MKPIFAIPSVFVLLCNTAFAYGIKPPPTGGFQSTIGVRPPASGTVGRGPSIGNFMKAQLEVAALMEIAGEDLTEYENDLINVGHAEPATLEIYSEWNAYYRSQEFNAKTRVEKSSELMALKVAMKHIAVSKTGEEFWN